MRVYAYGARPPIEGAHLVQQQLWLAHVYQRVLTLLERKRRELVERMYRQACPAEWAAYEAAQAACVEAAQAMRLTRAIPGDMLEADEDMAREKRAEQKAALERLADARQRELETRQAWKDARKRVTPRFKGPKCPVKHKRNESCANCRTRRLRMIERGVLARQNFAYNAAGSVGLTWGTRLKVGEWVERAADMAAKAGSLPKLPWFDGSGSVVVQLQGASGIEDKNGLAPADALGGEDTRLRLETAERVAWHERQGLDVVAGDGSLVRNGPRAGQPRHVLQPKPDGLRTTSRAELGHFFLAHLRVASDGRRPVWALWPVVMHRRLPETAPIKWAAMHAHRVGPRTLWELHLTIDDVLPAMRAEGHALAVNLGWRHLPNGNLRVAYAVGTDGHQEEVVVPPEFVEGMTKVDDLRSIRDKLLELAKTVVVEWAAQGERPDWFHEELRYVDRWKAPRKLVRFFFRWERQRFEGDEEAFADLEAWVTKDRHLWFWECDQRAKLLRFRRETYRVIAARWAKIYAHIYITDMDLRDFAEAPKPEEGPSTEGTEQRRGRILAAPSELRGAVQNASSTRGACCPRQVQRNRKLVVEGACPRCVDFAEKLGGAYKSQTCSSCGTVMAFAARVDLEVTCTGCGAREDQDERHSKNLLASVEVMRKRRGPLAPSVSAQVEASAEPKGRWQKRRSQTEMQAHEDAKRSA